MISRDVFKCSCLDTLGYNVNTHSMYMYIIEYIVRKYVWFGRFSSSIQIEGAGVKLLVKIYC